MKIRSPRAESAGRDFEKTERFTNMVLKHHTPQLLDRTPQGAVAEVRFGCVTAEGDQTPLELFLRVGMGRNAVIPLRSLGVCGTERRFMKRADRRGRHAQSVVVSV